MIHTEYSTDLEHILISTNFRLTNINLTEVPSQSPVISTFAITIAIAILDFMRWIEIRIAVKI